MNKTLRQIDLMDIFRRWRGDSGPFECFVRATPFVSLKHYPDTTIPTASSIPETSEELVNYCSGAIGKGHLLIVDLPGKLSLALARELHQKEQVKPILIFNQPLHFKGLVGDEEFVQRLMAVGSEQHPLTQCRGYALMLDYDRFGDYDENVFMEYFNNQYQLSEEDLPEFELLKHLGYTAVQVVTVSEIKTDLQDYLSYLQVLGLEVIVTGLGGFKTGGETKFGGKNA